MKLIVGLGNPGKKYSKTRHNIGFMIVDKMAGRERWGLKKKFRAEILENCQGYRMRQLVLVKPLTFMNESGWSVGKIVKFYKLSVNDLIVVHDDLDLKLGEYKIQNGVGPKAHNGVLSVERELGSKDFWRARVGIDNRANGEEGEGYVLSKFDKEELERVKRIVSSLADELFIMLE